MRFKHGFNPTAPIAMVLVSLTFGACSMRFSGKADPNEKRAQPQLNIAGDPTQCLSGYADKASLFIDGQLSEKDTGDFWDCASAALSLFTDKTKTEATIGYLPGELQHFLEKYFLAPYEQIPDGLVREAMVIKTIFVGGDTDHITREEIKKTQEWITVFKTEFLKIRPFLPITIERIGAMNDTQREKFKAELLNLAASSGAALSKTIGNYSLSSLTSLLHELSLLYTYDQAAAAKIENFRKQLPTAMLAKDLFVSPGRDVLRPTDWRIFFERGIDALFFFAESQKDWSYLGESPELLDQAQKLSDHSFRWIQIAISNQPGGLISFDRFKEIFEVVGEQRIQKLLGKPVKLTTIQEAFEKLITKILGSAVTKTSYTESNTALGLTRPALDYLQSEINQVINVQRSMIKLQNYRAGYSILDNALERDLAKLISGRPTLFGVNPNEITFAEDQLAANHSLHDLTQMTWMRAIVRFVFRAYSSDAARATQLSGVTIDEIDELYLDFRQLGVEMRFLDPRAKLAARNRFVETNLFSFNADGDALLNFNEMLDMMGYLYSGKTLARRMYDQMRPLCSDAASGVDVLYGYPMLSVGCFRSLFPKLLIMFTEKNMPAFSKYFSTLKPEDQDAAIKYIETSGRFIGATDTPVEAGDFDGIAVILHYAETFFQRFDTDRNSKITREEALKAFPIFKSEFAKMVAQQTTSVISEYQLESVFTYLLKYGESPTPRQLVWWMTRRKLGADGFEIDRLRMLQIFASFTAPTGTQIQATAQ